MNGKDSVLPLMDLLMRFVKLPLTFPIMCLWKIFPMDNVNSKTLYIKHANKHASYKVLY